MTMTVLEIVIHGVRVITLFRGPSAGWFESRFSNSKHAFHLRRMTPTAYSTILSSNATILCTNISRLGSGATLSGSTNGERCFRVSHDSHGSTDLVHWEQLPIALENNEWFGRDNEYFILWIHGADSGTIRAVCTRARQRC